MEIAVRSGEHEVYRSTNNLLEIQETRVHSFTVVDVAPTYSIDLKAS